MIREFEYSSPAFAIQAFADAMGRAIRKHARRFGQTCFAVGGGRTPWRVLPTLAARDWCWPQVTVTLTDDRCVAVDDPASNEGLVRTCFQSGYGADAFVKGLTDRSSGEEIKPDIVYLGFGEDAHVASIFPGCSAGKTDEPGVVQTMAPVAPYPRLTLTLGSILAAREIFVLVCGREKYRIYRHCRDSAFAAELPLARVLRQSETPVYVYIGSRCSVSK